MRIGYHKNILLRQGIMGTLYCLIGIGSLLDSAGRFLVVFLPMGLLHVGTALWQRKYKMLEFTANSVRVIAWFPKKELQYSDLTEVGVFAGDYKFKSGSKEIAVSKDSVATEDWELFLEKFKELQQRVQARANA